jgi:N-methylhydantoinase A
MNDEMRTLRVAIDIGGTFTDFVVYDTQSQELSAGKVLSSPDDAVEALVAGVDQLGLDLTRVRFVVHGTTVGLNAILEGNGATVGLVTSAGFRDVLEIGLMDKKEMYNLFYERPKPLVPRRRRFEVGERIASSGAIVRPLDRTEVRSVAEAIRNAGVDSVAVSTLNAYVNPAHELELADHLSGELGGDVAVSVSHQVANEWREFERTSTTVLNAYILPLFRDYLRTVTGRLEGKGLRQDVHIMKSSGGIMTSAAAAVRPIHALLSGPVGGAVGARAIATRHRSAGAFRNVVTADMGGTSFDAGLVIDGAIETDARAEVGGYPMLVPTMRVSAIGAGGGSIARVEGSTGLRVGPESAGARPGPACYARGGIHATVTDANVVLGRLTSSNVLGGEIAIDADAAARAIEVNVGEPLGLGVDEAAEGVLRVINSKMALAIRELTVAQGFDPGDFALLAFGGAGPMHAAEIAVEIGIPTVLIPAAPGMFSAWGMLAADVRHDVVKTSIGPAGAYSAEAIEATFRELEEQGRDELLSEGVDDDRISFVRVLDSRYVGQEHTLPVPVEPALDPETIKALFDDAHRRKYGHASERDDVELVNFRVSALGCIDKPEHDDETSRSAGGEPHAERPVYFSGSFLPTSIYRRRDLPIRAELTGPLVIDEEGATTVVPPDFRLTVADDATLIISTPESSR